MPFPWLAGMRVTAGRLNQHNPVFVFKGVDEDRTNTAAVAADSTLTLDLDDGLWEVTAFFDFSGTVNSGGLRVAWDIGSLSVASIRRAAGPDASSTDRLNTNMWHGVHNTSTEVRYGNRQGTALRSHAWESVVLQGPGTLTLLWSQITSHADVTRLAAGSYIKAVRVG